MFESKSGIVFVGGIGFFLLAFVSNAIIPVLMYQDIPEASAEELVTGNVRYQFEDLERRFPNSFREVYGERPSDPKEVEEWYNKHCAETLRTGRKIYVGEGCWHCHSQFVRPVSNEEQRYGAVSRSWEYQNELQRPVMFGTRRVGPDLSREGGRRSSDWHAVHFFKPDSLSEGSPMPAYPWFFNGSPDKPNARGLAIITYIQWLGSWRPDYPEYEQYEAAVIEKPVPESSDSDSSNEEE